MLEAAAKALNGLGPGHAKLDAIVGCESVGGELAGTAVAADVVALPRAQHLLWSDAPVAYFHFHVGVYGVGRMNAERRDLLAILRGEQVPGEVAVLAIDPPPRFAVLGHAVTQHGLAGLVIAQRDAVNGVVGLVEPAIADRRHVCFTPRKLTSDG